MATRSRTFLTQPNSDWTKQSREEPEEIPVSRRRRDGTQGKSLRFPISPSFVPTQSCIPAHALYLPGPLVPFTISGRRISSCAPAIYAESRSRQPFLGVE